jgi:hypothetical protein
MLYCGAVVEDLKRCDAIFFFDLDDNSVSGITGNLRC